jgi:hypothetical protein
MWKITEDLICNGSAVGTCSRDWSEDDAKERLMVKFRMYDDDGNLYYEGVIDEDAANPFGPLDDFGRPNDGCTTLYTFERMKWRQV